ncbi:MAG: hypothetical protein OXL37_06610 [Chloroflexota bacterium]|nr:hypothetical protein [Chloroflexota bacterium]MDE2960137.1 hypothetical protein [Chloroflexota bacterium]
MTSLEERVSRLEGGAEHLATKADVAEVKGEIAATKAEVKGEIASLRSWVAGGLAVLGIVLVALNVALRFWA